MRIGIVSFFVVAFLWSCETKKTPKTIGGEKTSHGCLPSAGETWSQLQEKCVRLFEDGLRLNPIVVEKDQAVLSAFILFNQDKSKAELFLPETPQTSFVLEKTGEDTYALPPYLFNATTATLLVNCKAEYSAKN